MTSIALSRRAETLCLSFVQNALMGLRRRRMQALKRKYLLDLADHLLRDLGLDRMNVMRGKF